MSDVLPRGWPAGPETPSKPYETHWPTHRKIVLDEDDSYKRVPKLWRWSDSYTGKA